MLLSKDMAEKAPEPRIGLVSVWPTASGTAQPGVATYTRTLSQILASQGYRCTVLANVDADVSMVVPGVTVVPTWRANDPLSGRRIGAAAKTHCIDIVHFQHELFLYGSYASAFAFPMWLEDLAVRVATVVTVHGVVDPGDVTSNTLRGRLPRLALPAARQGLSWIFHRIARSAAHKIVHSETLRDRLIAFGAAQEAVDVASLPSLLPAVASEGTRTKADARRILCLPPEAQVILTWGFDNSYKGFDVLAEGFALYRGRTREREAVLIVGMGPHPKLASTPSYMSDYEERAAALRSVDGVRFAGFIPDDELQVYLAASDVAIFPYTQYIAASGPVSAALGFGLPVLFSEVFKDMPHLLRFEPTPVAIADALKRFFAEPSAIAAATSALAREAAHEFVGSQYRRIYDALQLKSTS